MWVARNGARVGAAAFALGLSLAGPVVGVAAADGTDVASPAVSDAQSQAPTKDGTKATTTRQRRAATPTASPAGPAKTARSAGAPSAARTAGKPAAARRSNRGTAPATVAAANGDPQAAVTPQPITPSASTPAAETGQPTATTSSAEQTTSETPRQIVAKPVAALSITGAAATAAATDPISDLFGPIQSFVEGIGLLIRRTFFNQAPVVNPVQLTGQLEGPITGTVGAVDPEGDPITYSITGLPAHGIVTVAADGSYTYTPGTGFTDRDSFTVAATDTGFHINLLNLFRPASTDAFMQIAQNATQPMITFTFIYGSGSQYWSQAARAALQSSADTLVDYFVVTNPVNVT